MISVTYDSKSFFLLPYIPNWKSGVSAQFSTASVIDTGATNREGRESLRASLVAEIQYSVLLKPEERTQFFSGLDLWDNRPILVPFWPAMTLIGGTGAVVGALKIWFEPDFSVYEIGTGSEPEGFTPTAACFVAPVMWARFVEFPEKRAVNGRGVGTSTFRLIENGPPEFALGPNEVSLATSTVNGVTVPTLTETFAWRDNTAEPTVRIKRGKVGHGRGDADTYYPQVVREKFSLSFGLKTAGVRHILSLFANRKGSVGSFKCPTPWDPTSTKLSRFSKDSIALTWIRPDYAGGNAQTSIETITLPTETVAIAGETMGTTIGELADRWYGYRISDGALEWRYTSYESAIAGPGGDFEHAKIDHSRITEEIDLEISDCTLEVHHWTGSPFARLQRQTAAIPLTVQIFEGRLSAPEDAVVIFTGTAMAPDTTGPAWKIKLKSASSFLDTEGPRLTDQEGCVADFGDVKCGFNVASIHSTQSLTTYSGGVAVFTTGSPNEFDDHRFANGYAERTISGAVQRYMIVDSYDDEGDLACIVAEPILPPPTGTESGWVLIPGCRGSKAECIAWGNFVNFRAFPNRPAANPAMVPVKSTTGGKK